MIADFGLACKGKNPIYKRCGTPGFVTPEVLNHLEEDLMYDAKCDIFSVGIIFYILITGH